MTAPLTRAAHGSTRCVQCSRRFADTPELAMTTTEGEQQGWSGVDSAGQFRRSLTPTLISRRWHKVCLEEFERSNAEYRAQVEADRLATIQEIAWSTYASNVDRQVSA